MHSGQVAWATAKNSCLAAPLPNRHVCAVAAAGVPALQFLLGQPGCHSSQGRAPPQGHTPVWASRWLLEGRPCGSLPPAGQQHPLCKHILDPAVTHMHLRQPGSCMPPAACCCCSKSLLCSVGASCIILSDQVLGRTCCSVKCLPMVYVLGKSHRSKNIWACTFIKGRAALDRERTRQTAQQGV